MAQRQFRSDDTSKWADGYGTGSAGVLSQNSATDATANTTLTGTASSTSATVGSSTGFANGALVVIHQTQGTGAGQWELNKLASGGGTTSWTMTYPLINTYGTGAQVYLLNPYTTATVNSGQQFISQSWNGSKGGMIAILANQSITIPGSIVSSAIGFRGGIGSNRSANAAGHGQQGEGTSGTGTTTNTANVNGGGGTSGGGDGGAGGAGGALAATGTSGGSGQGTGGTGGNPTGSADLTSADFGGAGGGGQGESNAGSGAAGGGNGGNGGGFVLLIAPTITITGTIASNGANGGAGQNTHEEGSGGGGGGAGGPILLKGVNIILGSSLVSASAGNGGANGGPSSGAGGAGSVGRIHADYAGSVTGTTTPTIDTRQDSSLNAQGGSFLFYFL